MTQTPAPAADSVAALVGNTPLVRLASLCRGGAQVYAKLEGHNPGGSVKDRAALGMIEGAIARGELLPGMRLIEATSGNTGIALAMMARLKGVDIELVMPANATQERVQTMRAFGATVTLTPAAAGMEGAIDHARGKLAGGGYLGLNQFGNPDNPAAHYRGTGPEIWRDTDGQVTHFVSAMGTTGTIMGVSRYLKEQKAAVQIVGVQPEDGASIPGIRRWPPAYLPTIFEPERVDRVIDMSEARATEMARALARREAVFGGVSSGGAAAAALQVAEELHAAGREGRIVCIVCDRGDRYLSSPLFAE